MDAQRFDRVTTAFASRFSRRNVVKTSGLGLGVAALGAAGLRHAAVAQDAPATPGGSPVAIDRTDHLGLPEGERTYFMFVQTAQSGTWAEKAGEEGVYTLTLTGVPAQTVYFSDRPQRIVGTQSTTEFFDALGFTPENPPNAALVTQTDAGEDVLVIELFNPDYAEGDEPTLTYDARVLENYTGTGFNFLADRQDDLTMPESFDAASLFIDDCADQTIGCYSGVDNQGNLTGLVGTVKVGCCFSSLLCRDCRDYTHVCRDQFGAPYQHASGCHTLYNK